MKRNKQTFIIRQKHNKENYYKPISNEVLKSNLSYAAKGLLCQILSNDDTYRFRLNHCYHISTDKTVKKLIDELIEFGYCEKKVISSNNIKFFFYESPSLKAANKELIDITSNPISEEYDHKFDDREDIDYSTISHSKDEKNETLVNPYGNISDIKEEEIKTLYRNNSDIHIGENPISYRRKSDIHIGEFPISYLYIESNKENNKLINISKVIEKMETQNQDQNELDYFSDGAPIPGSSKIIEKKAEIFNLCLSDPELKNTIQNKGVIMDRFDEWLEWKKETTKNQFELKHVNYWLKAFQNWLEDEKRKEELIKDSEIKDKELWTKRNSNPYTDGVLSDEEIKERDRINREEYDKSIKAA